MRKEGTLYTIQVTEDFSYITPPELLESPVQTLLASPMEGVSEEEL